MKWMNSCHTRKPRTGLLLLRRQSLRRLTSPAKIGVLAEVPAETTTLPPNTIKIRDPTEKNLRSEWTSVQHNRDDEKCVIEREREKKENTNRTSSRNVWKSSIIFVPIARRRQHGFRIHVSSDFVLLPRRLWTKLTESSTCCPTIVGVVLHTRPLYNRSIDALIPHVADGRKSSLIKPLLIRLFVD